MTTEFKNAISRRVAPPRLLIGEDATTSTSGRAVSVTSDGAIPTAVMQYDGEPGIVTGVTGRIPKDLTYTISAGNDITVHPLVGGVRLIVTTAGAAAVSAAGKTVTLTNKNDDSTTVAAMQVLIAASASVSALLTIDGTALDTFDHLLTLADTPLWTTGTIPAQAMVVLGSDGYYWPAEADATGGLKVSQTSLIAGEDLTAARLKIMPKTTNGSGGAAIAASGTAHNAACVVHRLMVAETAGANPVTVYLRDGGAGGTIRTPVYTVPADGSISLELNLAFATDCYMVLGGAGTPSAGVSVHSG